MFPDLSYRKLDATFTSFLNFPPDRDMMLTSSYQLLLDAFTEYVASVYPPHSRPCLGCCGGWEPPQTGVCSVCKGSGRANVRYSGDAE